jgi:hypothetical protein
VDVSLLSVFDMFALLPTFPYCRFLGSKYAFLQKHGVSLSFAIVCFEPPNVAERDWVENTWDHDEVFKPLHSAQA